MIYAPVIIPTLCRAEHLKRCVESLRKNTWADKTDVYIGLDYPAKEKHWDGYSIIKQYLEGDFPEFRSFRVFIREENYGSSKNTRSLRKECSKEHDRFILLEDDLEVSPDFLQYMDEALSEYEDDESVVGVTGYSYPISWIADPACTVVRENFTASAWGRGFWNKKREKVARFLKPNGLSRHFSSAYRDGKFQQMLDFAVKDYVTLSRNGWSAKNAYLNTTTDVAMRIYLAVCGRWYIMPLVSKVRNHGYDGSGANCQKIDGSMDGATVSSYDFSRQPIDTETTFTLVEDKQFPLERNRQLLNDFDAVPKEDMDKIWMEAEKIAAGGKYYGLFKRMRTILYRIKH